MTGCDDQTCSHRADCHRATSRNWSNGTLDMAWLRTATESCGAFVARDEVRDVSGEHDTADRMADR